MVTAIEPLVPADVDLREYRGMMLDVVALRDSEFTSSVTPEEFRAGVLLWCAAWHQKPAATLPNDDRQLSTLAGYGYAVAAWKKVRDGALYGWKLATDGRLHHKMAAKTALAAWDSFVRNSFDHYVDRLRKANKKRAETRQPPLPFPSLDDWKSAGRPNVFPRIDGTFPPESETDSAGIPKDFALNRIEGNRTKFKGDGKQNPDDLGKTHANATGKVAEGKKSKINGAGQQWDDPAWVDATAKTVNIARIEGESNALFRDRIHAHIQSRMTEGKATK